VVVLFLVLLRILTLVQLKSHSKISTGYAFPSYPTPSTTSKTSHGNPHDPGKSHANPAGHDDMSDVTVNNGTTSEEKRTSNDIKSAQI
jgi:hypothetical protein